MRFLFLILLLLVNLHLIAQIPENPNVKDAKGRRQGKWTLRMDEKFKETHEPSRIAYYRIITYKDSKPVGVTTDYYLNGNPQAEFTLVTDHPEDVYTGTVTWYREDGTKETEGYYDGSGQLTGYKKFRRDGKPLEMLSDTLNARGIRLQRSGKLNEAISVFQEALLVAKEEYGEDHATYINIENNLGIVYYDRSEYQQAEIYYRSSMEKRKRLLGVEHPDYALSLNNLGQLYADQGKLTVAEPMMVEAREVMLKAKGEEDANYIIFTSNLATLYVELADYTRAEELYLELRKLLIRLGAQNTDYYATAMNNLGDLYNSLGEFEKSKPILQEARQAFEVSVGKDHPSYATALSNLARVHQALGENAASEAVNLEAIEILGRVVGKEHPTYAGCINNLAYLYKEAGQYEKALPLYEESVRICVLRLGKHHPQYAMTINNLGACYLGLNEFDKAEPLYLESLKVREEALGKDHPDYASALNNLGTLYWQSHRLAKAEPYFIESVSRVLSQIAKYFPAMSENEKKVFYDNYATFFVNFEVFCLDRYTENPAILGEWYNVRLATKGILFNTSNKIRQRILQSNDQSLMALFDDWKSKKNYLAGVYKMTVEARQKENIDEQILEAEVVTIEKQLSKRSELFANAAESRQFTWKDVKQTLVHGEAALEIIRTLRVSGDSSRTVYVGLITKAETTDHPEVVIIEEGEMLETKYSLYYRNAIKQNLRDELTYEKFWKPFSDKLKGVRKLYFSADGAYNQINPNTLLNPASNQFVLDELEIQLVTSTKDLLDKHSTNQISMRSATLFGFPDYNHAVTSAEILSPSERTEATETPDQHSLQRFFNGENITELPGTKKEVETIVEMLEAKKIPTKSYQYQQATEDKVKQLRNPSLLHIATHGFFLADPAGSTGGFAGIGKEKLMANPLLRSGLLFAGARATFDKNAEQHANQEDGVLTAYEAMSLNLDQTEMVILSACETGLGVSANGEGVYGLQRAFRVAGAQSVLMSLWTVSDEATQELMVLFYKNWLSGKKMDESFQLAQRALRVKFPDPFFWGAFVLVGSQ